MGLLLPVDLRGGGEQYSLVLLCGKLQHELRGFDVRLYGANGLLHDEAHPYGSRQMKDLIRAIHQFCQQRPIQDRINRVREARMAFR